MTSIKHTAVSAIFPDANQSIVHAGQAAARGDLILAKESLASTTQTLKGFIDLMRAEANLRAAHPPQSLASVLYNPRRVGQQMERAATTRGRFQSLVPLKPQLFKSRLDVSQAQALLDTNVPDESTALFSVNSLAEVFDSIGSQPRGFQRVGPMAVQSAIKGVAPVQTVMLKFSALAGVRVYLNVSTDAVGCMVMPTTSVRADRLLRAANSINDADSPVFVSAPYPGSLWHSTMNLEQTMILLIDLLNAAITPEELT